jgi:hypothetical protein
LLFPPDGNGANMRKPDGASIAAGKTSLPAGDNAPMQLVCLALALALVALSLRIASIW